MYFVGVSDKFHALKPYEVYDSATVGEVSHDAFSLARTHCLHRENLPAELNVWHIAVYVTYLIYMAAVNVFVWVIGKQFANSGDVQFLGEELGAVGTYALQVFYVLSEYAHFTITLSPRCLARAR